MVELDAMKSFVSSLLTRFASLKRFGTRSLLLLRAIIIASFTKQGRQIRDENIWLFGGSSGMKYADNSAILYKYMRTHHSEINARWVISRKSPDVDLAKKDGDVLFLEDFDSYLYGLLANVHVISHGVHDIPTCGSRLSRAFKVRLGHGMTALVKRKPPTRLAFNSLYRIFDLVPVCSEFEKGNKMEWGFSPQQIRITGLTRFDTLLEKYRSTSGEDAKKHVLYMPTARDWLIKDVSKFGNSEYCRKISEFLRYVNEPLRVYGIRISLYVHPLMWDNFDAMRKKFAFSQVDLLPLNADLQQELAQANLFVTDYSSVAWDALYIDCPTMFYQFDFEEYFKHRGGGSHLDMKKDLFGPRVQSPQAAADKVMEYIESDFSSNEYREMMDQWKAQAFYKIDARNCERVAKEIFAIHTP